MPGIETPPPAPLEPPSLEAELDPPESPADVPPLPPACCELVANFVPLPLGEPCSLPPLFPERLAYRSPTRLASREDRSLGLPVESTSDPPVDLPRERELDWARCVLESLTDPPASTVPESFPPRTGSPPPV